VPLTGCILSCSSHHAALHLVAPVLDPFIASYWHISSHKSYWILASALQRLNAPDHLLKILGVMTTRGVILSLFDLATILSPASDATLTCGLDGITASHRGVEHYFQIHYTRSMTAAPSLHRPKSMRKIRPVSNDCFVIDLHKLKERVKKWSFEDFVTILTAPCIFELVLSQKLITSAACDNGA
jgi:hypothetical protein